MITATAWNTSRREARRLAEAASRKSGTPVVWLLWTRSTWGCIPAGNTLAEATPQGQVIPIFKSEAQAKRFVRYQGLGGNWVAQPYDLATVERTCAEGGNTWRMVEDVNEAPQIVCDVVHPETGEVLTVWWQNRKGKALTPLGWELLYYTHAVGEWLQQLPFVEDWSLLEWEVMIGED